MSVTTEKVIVQVSVDGQVTLVSNISSALGAASSAAVAEAAAAAALVSETNADASEAVAVASAAAALISENNSAASESAAAASELAALNSKNAASTSESNALISANNADISEAAAAASAAAALVSQNAAASSASSAATSTTTLVQGGTLNASFASIKSSGDIVLAGTKKFYVDGVGGVGGDTYLTESSANVLDIYAGGVNVLKAAYAGGVSTVTVTGNLSISDSISVPNSSISAIDRTVFGATITDAFIYDTSKDSDGGAWRKRCAHTSWENETLSGNWLGSAANETAARAISGATTGSYYYDTTAAGFYTLNAGSGKTATYRGNVRQFPAKVLITVEAARVVLWDVTQANCPMWMVFINGAGLPIVTSTINAAWLTNGVMGVATTVGFVTFDFLKEHIVMRYVGSAFRSNLLVASRNSSASVNTRNDALGLMASDVCNYVAMTVLPNAPVDIATGLPVPTIAVATEGGVSVIKNDGTVTSKTITQLFSATLASSYKTNYIAFTKNKNLVFNYAYNSAGGYGEVAVADTSLTVLARYGADYTNTTSQLLSIDQSTDISGLCALAAGKNEIILGLGTGDAVNPPGTGTGLGIIHDNPATVGSGLYAEITKNYNSGWQVGAIKGAWLADTVAETLTGTELVTNGTFTTDTSGWTAEIETTLSIDTNRLKILKNGGSGAFPIARQNLTVVAGKTYVLAFNFTTGSIGGYLGIGSTSGAQDLYSAAVADGPKFVTVTATTTTLSIRFMGASATNGVYVFVDDISCSLADVDRSVKAKGLRVFGSITKSAVASGAALMGYSGFSAANYFEQPYNSDLDFGTGDFCIMGWVKEAPNSANEYLYHRAYWTGAAWSGPAIVIYFNASGTLAAQITDDAYATVDAVATSAALDDSVWRFACLVRRTTTLELWINGVLVSSTTISAAAASLSNTSATCAIGRLQSATSPATNATKALWRTGATAPSAEQIKHIYETEKELFNASANCCLAGTSNAVTALAYDDETDLLHVGTSYGRSAFKGLVRVSSEATPVGAITALAASGGFIAQGGATGADIYVPAYTLREELLRSAEQIAKMGSTLEPIWTTATASQTAFQMNVGWQPKYVYRNGLVLREGATEDYSISFDGFRWTVTLADASIVGDNICIMGVRTNG